jgi:ribonuclease HI
MELMGAIAAFKAIDDLACHLPCEVVLVSDSQYVINGMKSWLCKWKQAGWKTASNKPVKNQKLWQELSEVSKEHEVQWVWTQGHSDCPENNRCDELAVVAIEQRRLQNVS